MTSTVSHSRAIPKARRTRVYPRQGEDLRVGELVAMRSERRAALDAAASTGDLVALGDKALFSVTLFGFVRVGAAVRMLLRDFDDANGELALLVLHEKGGKERRIPCHHRAREALRAYVAAAGFEPRARVPLFQSAPWRGGVLSGGALSIHAGLRTVKRRCRAAGLPAAISNHSFRATGITLHQESGGRLEEAQELAGQAPRGRTGLDWHFDSQGLDTSK